MADYYTLLTNAGIAYETACKAAGVPIKLSQISVGDGGGEVYNPAATATALKREVWRGPLNALFQDEKNPSWLLAEVTIPPEVGGWYVREAGLWTDTGILYAIVKYPESFKPVLATSGSGKEFYIRSIFETSNASLVTLLIDDTVVRATRAWVMGYLADELAKLDGKQSVRVVATENIVLSGAQQVDGVAMVSGQRVLVAGQAAAKDNGIYVAGNGAWVRAVDANSSAKVTPGLTVMVEEGSANGGSLWRLVTSGPITLDTTALSFEMLAGRTGIQAGSYKSLTVDKYGRVVGGTNPDTLAGMGIKDSYTKAEIESMIAQASALPVGTMVAFPVNKVPPGFLEIDGSVKSIAVYPDLATFLGTSSNKGDEGAGNFRLPESRGEYLRGWDHGRGIDAGRGIGTYQGASYLYDTLGQLSMPNRLASSVQDEDLAGRITRDLTVCQPSVTTNTASYVDTGRAVRTRNLSVMWCIKAWNAPINQGNIDIAALVALAALATETNQGTAKVATQTQVNEGTDDATIVTPKKLRRGFAINLATNGYVALPTWLGGLIIQWGNVNGVTYNTANGFLQTPVTWPIAFPTAVLATSTSIVTGIAGNAFVNTSLELRTKVGGSWIYSSGVVGNTPILSYIAIGY
ncbi:phage tail protein [Pseudomonas sp. H3(2019)]|uniref:phage tail-collar fiber domain-containing protein n=1 Tax=Pseudomonas sp. H3(2019) TaxID=2598724 RepID=UPI00119496C2|nr:phage tail protein [Pseudomonas sp. H3(2019)]TVT82385.1 phage tail protein [Pseudomonas sp. H3(2019)]